MPIGELTGTCVRAVVVCLSVGSPGEETGERERERGTRYLQDCCGTDARYVVNRDGLNGGTRTAGESVAAAARHAHALSTVVVVAGYYYYCAMREEQMRLPRTTCQTPHRPA